MIQNDIVQKLWGLCDILRDDGINYSDYVTELVLLLFIKMVHENQDAGTAIAAKHPLPSGCHWEDLIAKDGLVLMDTYKRILLALSTGKVLDVDEKGDVKEKQIHNDPLILAIYADAQTRLREPRHLKQLIENLDKIDWFSATRDGLGDLYEGLLEKNATETKSGAGQYFTPRPLINSMIKCIKPQPGETIQDPAAGTAGFLIAADRYIKDQTDELFNLTAQQQKFQKSKAFIGVELVPSTRRLALMNCLLHGMEGEDEGVIHLGNSLGQVGAGLARADIIFANPPFGTAKGGEASITRDDLTFTTSNKQLAFLQHIYRNLKPGGRAAIVFPDNVLFEAGVGTDIRRDLMNKCNLHTILRLPTGIFYAQGVKTNVLFFTKGSAKDKYQDENCTQNVWVYDLRTNIPSFGKRTPFTQTHLQPFERVFDPTQANKLDFETLPKVLAARQEGEWSFTESEEQTTENSRWRCFSREWIAENKGDSLDISWLKDKDSVDAANLPEPVELASEAKQELEAALVELDALLVVLGEAK